MVSEFTRSKVRIFGSDDFQETLRNLIGSENLPVAYGGTLKTSLSESPEERLLLNHVRRLNGRA